MPPVPPAIELQDVGRSFGQVHAVSGVTLAVADGEFFSMLGPSGSGKTTCLRLIAGFDFPTSGRILLHGEDASRVPPYDRDVNTVFQDYALFPHLSVQENVEYGLRMKGVAKAERARAAQTALEQVALGGLGGRRPSQLSGGQRQRVALARALVNQPRVLLLDEPLGALDLKLREQMQLELKSLQRKLGITFVYVTHDQGEALSMSDRVAVFNQGKLEQVDTPRGLYERPRTVFVAGFVGTANILEGAAAAQLAKSHRPVAIRPEQLRLGAPADGELSARGTLLELQYHGATSRLTVQVGQGSGAATFAVSVPSRGEAGALALGSEVELAWPREAMVPLEASAPPSQTPLLSSTSLSLSRGDSA
jgi:putative spermidine/putrescine transport system ATP-binding protein